MDFGFTSEEEAFRDQVRAFIAENPRDMFSLDGEDMGYGLGAWSRQFNRKLGEKGWISLTWPSAYGGQAQPMMFKLILWEECAYHQTPFYGTTMAESMAHVIMEMGTDALKKEVLPGIAGGEIAFWLGFSEPNAGSDLLGLETRAVEDGDVYVLNGQKVWSSNAHLADYGYVLARTDPNVPRHKGLSVFAVNSRLPGVTIKPLINIEGKRFHNQVFFDNARVPKYCLIGQKNNGIYQMLKGLEHDRFWSRFPKPAYCRAILEELVAYARDTSLSLSPQLRARLADSAIEIETCRLIFYHAASMIQHGLALTYESSVGKVLADEMGQRLFQLGTQLLGPGGQLMPGSRWVALQGKIARLYLVSRGHTLAGGTSEVNRSTIATRGLRLPR